LTNVRQPTLVALDDIGVRLGSTTVIRNITWRLEPGQRWAIVGGNGAGKTSLLKLIAGEYWPNHGLRRYDFGAGPETDAVAALREVQLVSHTLEERYEKFGWNFQATLVVLTGIWGMSIPRRKATAQELGWALTCLQRMGAIAFANRPLLTLSRGERRRVLLARALASKPRLLLLDEGMAGLDQQHRQRLAETLVAVATHTPLVLSQHHRRDLPDWITHVLELAEGEVVACGPNDPQPQPQPQRLQHSKPAAASSNGKPLVKIEAADVWLGERRVLQQFNWRIQAGEHWLVTGANGAGKSTLLRLLHGQLRPAKGGHIEWLNHQPQDGIDHLRQRVAWVAPALETDYRYPDSVRATLASGFASSLGLVRRPTAAQWQRVDELLETLHLTEFATRSLQTLSYGQRRRAMIGRALVNGPMLLLLDEPTEGMDDDARHQFETLLAELTNHEGCQLVCASHLVWGETLFTHRLDLGTVPIKTERCN
jgi:molybdate transport system ATP-binding protein